MEINSLAQDEYLLSSTATKKGRVSQFREELDLEDAKISTKAKRPIRRVRFRSIANVFEAPDFDSPRAPEDEDRPESARSIPDYSVSLKEPVQPNPRPRMSTHRLVFFTFFIAIALTLLHNSPLIGSSGVSKIGVKGGVIRSPAKEKIVERRELVERDDATNYCKRWAHQSAMVNGTIYIYGGRMTTSDTQNSDEWNNNFLTLDATKTWQISTPPLAALPQPSGPPAVASGNLWHSFTSLFLYGGEYSEMPTVSPSSFALWSYDIPSQSWSQHSSPSTSSGNSSDGGNQPVQNAAEGAGVSVPALGRGYYFGGHLDFLTTQGWSYYTTRVYLKSLLEFTFPGFTNNGVQGLSNQAAGDGGAWRNITQGNIQSQNGFSERADGLLVYVPGFGAEGIILGLAGGNNESFQLMNIIDVYDVATSSWYQQTTTGKYPDERVNPCAVAASAPDGSSTNIYMFGGQNLQPTSNQTQYNDMWILSVPSFTWISVDTSDQSTPHGRAGHTCEIWDGQMIVIGGYLGNSTNGVECEYPGIYVFDLTNLKWETQFNALTGSDPQNQQAAQSENPNALAGSYGYEVPAVVQSVIGGQSAGAATVTGPIFTPTGGPLATGTPIIYTITESGGSILVTQTAAPGTSGTGSTTTNANSGPNVAAIVAGTIAGVLFIIACYLGFCAYVYRRQLQLYKNHVAAAQRAAVAAPNEKVSFLAATSSSDEPSSRRSGDVSSSGPSSNRTGPSGYGAAGRAAPPVPPLPGAHASAQGQTSTANSSTDDLMVNHEPTFMGVLLSPRRSLRVINRD